MRETDSKWYNVCDVLETNCLECKRKKTGKTTERESGKSGLRDKRGEKRELSRRKGAA